MRIPLAALIVCLLLASCVDTPSVAISSAPASPNATSTAGPTILASASPSAARATASPRITEAPTAGDERLIASVVAFARAPRADTFAAVPFADDVSLGLGDKLLVERRSRDLAEADAWVLRLVPFRGRVGPFTALGLLADTVPTITSAGPHAYCGSPPTPTPAPLASLRRVGIQRVGIDTCLLWWTVDIFVTPAGRIQAVTLDLYDP
jgi:hypothetical protein